MQIKETLVDIKTFFAEDLLKSGTSAGPYNVRTSAKDPAMQSVVSELENTQMSGDAKVNGPSSSNPGSASPYRRRAGTRSCRRAALRACWVV